MRLINRANIVEALQTDILRLQGFKPSVHSGIEMGLGPIKDCFPGATFPFGAVHEFVTPVSEVGAATSGFIAGLLAPMMSNNGVALWISSSRKIYPPALKIFRIQPDRIIFIDLENEKDVLPVMEEALKCGALTAVIGEVKDLSFTASRRLQLSVEQSRVTGFLIRKNIRKLNTSACVARWKITSIPSEPIDDLPGIGYPQWRVELLRIRNGRPGIWTVRWKNGGFEAVESFHHSHKEEAEIHSVGFGNSHFPQENLPALASSGKAG